MASGAIKGITVQIGGDSTKLGKAITDSEKKSRSLQVELRQVEKLLKFDPTNVELLTQKQNILADTIAETSKKLDTLKEAEAQVVAQFEKGEIGEDQLRAFQREIIQTEKSLSDMQAELVTATHNLERFGDNNGVAKEAAAKLEKEIREQNEALEAEKKALEEAEKAHKDHEQAVADAKEELADFGDKVSGAIGAVATGAAAVGGAAIAAGGYALNLSTDFDKALNTLATRTGATADEMDGLETSMENIYRNNFGESVEDVAESMATVRAYTGMTGEELEKTTEDALLMRDVFGYDVTESTRAADMLMQQYGMSAHEAYNLIAQGAQNGMDKNGDMLDVINEYAVHFSNLGIDAEDMFNILIEGAEAGSFSIDKAGDAMKEFGIRVKDGTADDAFKALGLNVKDTTKAFAAGGDQAEDAFYRVNEALASVEDPVERNKLGVQLYGTMWEDMGEDAVLALSNCGDYTNRAHDSMAELNDIKYDDIGSALEGLGRTLETDVVKPLGEELKPVVEEAIEYVQTNGPQIKEVLSGIVEKIGEFVGFIVDNADAILSTIAGIGAGLLIWNVVSMITGVVNAIKAFKLANEGATVAQWLMNAAMNANPIGILITVIGAIVVAIGTFIATNEDARTKFLEIWEKIKEVCKNVIDAIVNFFTVTIPEAWNNFLIFLSGFIDSVVTFFSELPGKIWTWLSDTVNKIATWGSDMWTQATTAVQNLIDSVVNFFKELPGKIWNAIVSTVQKIATWGSNIKTKAVSAVTSLISSVVSFMQQLPGKIWNAIVGAVQKIAAWGSNIVSKAKTAASNMVNGVLSFVRQLPTKIYNAIQGAISRVISWGSGLLSAAKNAVRNMVTGAVDAAKSLPDKFLDIGKNVIEGIKNGITGAVSGLYTSIKNALGGLVDKAKEALGIKSPSRVFANIIGKQIPAGIAMGIDDNTNVADTAVQNMTDDLTNQAIALNGATINRKLAATFSVGSSGVGNRGELLTKLDNIYERLNRLQIVLDTGTLVGETIDKIDAGLATKQILNARGV